ncbi:MAG: DedA family protein [Bacteroidetes bacterium]|nr:MAG: DedA family protein [Bacteroidota bacterium]
MTTTFTCLASGFLMGWQTLFYIIPLYFFAQSIGYYIAKKIDSGTMISFLGNSKKLNYLLENIHTNQSKLVFLARISPVLPFSLTNLIFGMLQINFWVFTWAGLLGMLPRSILAVWLGINAKDLMNPSENSTLQKTILIILGIISILLIMKLLFQKNQPKQTDLEEEQKV